MLYQTIQGIPLDFEFSWPVHPSQSGSDWSVLHGKATVTDSSGLHADVAVNLSRAVVQALPSLEPADVAPVAINAVRKFLDTRDLELLKSGKRQPVNASSRVYSIVRNQWTFQEVSDAELLAFLERKVFWACVGAGKDDCVLVDAVDALYFNSPPERLLKAATELASRGAIQFNGRVARPTPELAARAPEFRQVLAQAIAELEAKHAFERA